MYNPNAILFLLQLTISVTQRSLDKTQSTLHKRVQKEKLTYNHSDKVYNKTFRVGLTFSQQFGNPILRNIRIIQPLNSHKLFQSKYYQKYFRTNKISFL